MSEKKLTMLELHFGDVQIGPSRSGDGAASDNESATDVEVAAESGGLPVGPKAVVAALVGLGLVGGLALVAKQLLGGDTEQATLDDPTFGEEEEFEPADLDE